MKKLMKKLKQKNDIGYICSTFGNQYMLTVAMEECAELLFKQFQKLSDMDAQKNIVTI